MERKLIYKVIFILAVIGTCIYYTFPLDKRINLGLDLKGGMHLLLKVDTSHLPEKARADAADRALEVVRNRIDSFGVREPSIQKQGDDEIVVQLPGVTDRERAIDIIGKTALLEFKLVSADPDKLKEAIEGKAAEDFELKYATEDNEPLLLEKQALLTGDTVADAQVRFDQSSFNEPAVSIKFNAEGAKKFGEITAANIGRRLAIVLDGKVQSAPRIKDAIPSGEGIITGRFDIEQAQDLAIVLRIGALPAPMVIEEERTVGPLLGQDSINKGVKATLIGGAMVFIFMAIYYLIAGLVANIALILNLLIITGCLGMLPYMFPGVSATLTLPGIAGMALALGMAVDANVLINERIREELALGRNLKAAIANGYNRAFSAIFDSNLTTLIAAFLLFQFGTGPIRGFAVTLTIGLMASMFTAIVVTRTIFELLLKFGWLKSFPMLKFIGETKLDFIGKRKVFYVISAVVIIAGLVVFFQKGSNAFGIDFAGGQLQEYSFKNPPQVDKIRQLLKDLDLGDASIQQFRDNPKAILIRSKSDKNQVLMSKLREVFPDEDVQMLRIEHVGPIAGKHLKGKAFYAIVWSLAGILIYVGFRFKHINFALAGVIALIHDVLVALGFLVMTGRQIDLLSVTAFLTIAGYSINDTIVIYDRVRENMRNSRKMSLAELINLSVNQTLARTVLTSSITLFVVLAILFYGGEVLSNFAFTLVVGFVSGVYSTVFIASPLVLAWQKKKVKL
ncbi:MAG: protein translocase subunit SecD [Candidatus Omnitrophota bacterium]|nr:protein translocase subunit SecD [Candidatus Omnitrophota bacterium]MBU1929196.1 protein translocase subunit SecD [Candidatus Omnitrophota bacterium]MBU2035487.1 protein translocase subunit SecD [Candidatus Omnitrophota bacterium]MBU2221605.1 protein translocase subunit SecD [Candidatus Omnitrophota bacterium]MBU2257839.1 protein translocase subunit SecD [Candidatus Omnitrophota bacterium]